jgi:alanine racemase
VLRGVTAEIDLEAAKHNLQSVRKAVNDLPVIAVVKADAYGHGARELSRAFTEAGASALAVAFISEAAAIREAGVKAPLLVLFDDSGIEDYFDLGLTPVIHDLKTAEALSREASKRATTLDVHLKVDTGMARLGFTDEGEMARVPELPNLRVTGLMSHFSEADLADRDYARLQLERFGRIRSLLGGMGLRPLSHMANSAATLSFSDSHLDAVRPGLALYGCLPSEDGPADVPLRPIMSLKARILSLRRLGKGRAVSYGRTFITRRETLAATLAVGYGDGYSRLFSNNSYVLLRGRRAPVIGRVCMDLMVVDATEAGDLKEGQEAVLLGSDGKESITLWELARRASSIPYEIMLSMGGRANRVYRAAETKP